MKFIFSSLRPGFFFLLLLGMVSLEVFAKEIPILERRVTWEEGTISQTDADNWERALEEHEGKTSNQVAILVIRSLEGEILEEYSLKVAEEWKLGQKNKDNGVLILLSMDDRKVRIEVGYGLEGILTDAYCNRVIQKTMIPHFKSGEYETGISTGLGEILSTLDTGVTPEEPSLWQQFQSFRGIGAEQGWHLYLIGLIFVGIIFLFAFISAFHQSDSSVSIFFFLLIFFQWVPSIFYGFYGWVVCNFIYIFGFILVRLTRDKVSFVKSLSDKVTDSVIYSSGSSSGGGWSSGGGSSGGFSGGGGSFGGGGSSGSW
ncbi:TPM domain-containing protein [Leptospira kanakyensis]|uniref:TPM domain-containing protein n=1 Tax=Leptospira kanakyensis TaxID=2484968 RepID=UPI00223D892D|nr:TPM domain-containing protein [Leptospira kanakyensis]MCW7470849.1 TPM domain-containing protein [Leptospira kanakyensis]